MVLSDILIGKILAQKEIPKNLSFLLNKFSLSNFLIFFEKKSSDFSHKKENLWEVRSKKNSNLSGI